jgi:membrane associated rhomboid family serine protease
MNPSCYNHPDRPTGASCTRCGRPICPDCMIQAPVGHHCPNCVREANKGRPTQVRWTPGAGGRVSQLTPVVKALIAINAVAFLYSSARPSFEFRYAQIPVEIARGQYERLLTAAFLHANLLHIFFNMFALAIFGPALEVVLGRWRFIALYAVAALGGSVCSYVFSSPNIEGVGASGAIFGLFGAYFVIARQRRVDTSQVVGLIVVNLIISFAIPLIDWRAHIGGLITGALVAGVFGLAERRPAPQRRAIEVAAFAAIAAVLVLLVHVRTDHLRHLIAA